MLNGPICPAHCQLRGHKKSSHQRFSHYRNLFRRKFAVGTHFIKKNLRKEQKICVAKKNVFRTTAIYFLRRNFFYVRTTANMCFCNAQKNGFSHQRNNFLSLESCLNYINNVYNINIHVIYLLFAILAPHSMLYDTYYVMYWLL